MSGKSLNIKLLLVFFALYEQAQCARQRVELECKDTGAPFYPHPEDCTKFYECINGEITEYQCPEGLHFNPGYSVCDYPEFAGCRVQSTSTTASATTESVTGTTNAPTEGLPETTENPAPETTGNPAPETTENPATHHPDCPWDADLTYHPISGDCASYYQCYGGGQHIFRCPPGLYFNPTAQACDYPENVDCENGTQGTTTTTSTTTTTASPGEITDGTTDGNTQPPSDSDCPLDADLSFHPIPENCKQFYQCYGGEKQIFECPEDLHFNPAAQVCDYPELAGCQE